MDGSGAYLRSCEGLRVEATDSLGDALPSTWFESLFPLFKNSVVVTLFSSSGFPEPPPTFAGKVVDAHAG